MFNVYNVHVHGVLERILGEDHTYMMSTPTVGSHNKHTHQQLHVYTCSCTDWFSEGHFDLSSESMEVVGWSCTVDDLKHHTYTHYTYM